MYGASVEGASEEVGAASGPVVSSIVGGRSLRIGDMD